MTAARAGWSAGRALGLEPGEAAQAWPAVWFQVVLVAAVAVLKSGAAALVVGRTSAGTLPVLYVASALATALASGLLPRRYVSAPSTSLYLWALGILSLSILARQGVVGAVLGLYVAGDAFATLNQVRFWARAGELFDLRASRRLFAAFAAASMVGAVTGGLLVQSFSDAMPTEGLTLLGGFLAIAAAPLGKRFDQSGPHRSRGSKKGDARLKDLWDDPLLVRVALFVLLCSALTITVDYLFRARAGERMSERELAHLFGAINVWMGLVSAAFQLALARRLLESLGLFPFLTLIPLLCAALGGLAMGTTALGPVVVLKVVEAAGALSLTPLAVQLLYGPLPEDKRAAARSAIDGLVKKGGLGLGGVALMFWGRAAIPYLPGLVLAIGVGLVAVISRMHRVYVAELTERLARSHWDADIALDAQGRGVLRRGLSSDQPGVALASLQLLGGVPDGLDEATLRPLLSHPHERVQTRAVALAGELAAVGLVPELRALLASPRRRPRDEAVRVLARLAPEAAQGHLLPLLDHADPGTRGAALAALWSHPPARAAAEAALLKLQQAPGLPERRELARTLGRLDRASAYAPLKLLLDDPDPSVRALAYGAAAELGVADWTAELLGRLRQRADRPAVRAALARLGDAALPQLGPALDDRALPLSLRLELPRVLRDIGTSAAANVLLHSNIDDEAALQHRIGVALSAMRRAHPKLSLDLAWVKDALGRRLDAYERLLPIQAAIRARLPDSHLLVRALGDRLDQAMDVAFRLLALLAPHDVVMDAHQRLRAGGPKEKSFAAELVENLAPDRRLGRRLAHAVDGWHRLAARGDALQFEPALRQLAAGRDRVLAGCARAAARAHSVAVAEGEGEAMSDQVVETLLLLEGVELFGRSGVDEMAALAALAREERAAAGQFIFRKGDPGDRFFVVVAGQVRIEQAGRGLFTLGPKDSFGEVSILDGAPRPADVVAVTDCHLLSIDREAFLDLVADRPELLQGVLAQVAHHLRLLLEGPGGGQVTLKRPVSGW